MSFSGLSPIARSCTFLAFMGLAEEKIKKKKTNQDLEEHVAKEQDLESGMEIHNPVGLVILASELSA